MTVELHGELGGRVQIVNLSGKLVKADYERFTPEVERAVKEYGKIRFLVRMHDFQGWTAGALWSDIKFDWKHFSGIERLAFIGDKRWEAGMAEFCKPFTTAKIKYFDESQANEASVWIREGIPELAVVSP